MKKLMKKESDVLDSQVMKTDLTPLSAAVSGSLHQFNISLIIKALPPKKCMF